MALTASHIYYGGHLRCDAADRMDHARCVKCFRTKYGELIAKRRCYFCSTDAFHRSMPWEVYKGHLSCHQCADLRRSGRVLPVRSRSLVRVTPGTRCAPYSKRQDIYYHLVDFKNAPGHEALVAPLGNALARNVERLLAEESIDEDVIIMTHAPSAPGRDHAERLTAHAAKALDLLGTYRADIFSKKAGVKSQSMALAAREGRQISLAPDEDVTGKVVIVCDDLYTSGNTIAHCTEAAMAAGASAVYGATIGRVVNVPEARSSFDGKVLTTVRKVGVDDSGVLSALPRGCNDVELEFLCGECPAVIACKLPIPDKDATHVALCAQCAAESTVTLARRGSRVLLSLEGRRASEVIHRGV